MKGSTCLSGLALALSIAALIMAATSRSALSEEEIARQVDVALSRREKAFVQAWAPRMEQVYQDMLGPRYAKPPRPPETLSELFQPALEIMSGMTSQ